jgi:nucleotide-binding universal stress UspA family protein
MSAIKKILVPCDFSEPAINAFRFAVDMAGKSKGEIILLHVIALPESRTQHMPVLSPEETAFFKTVKDNAEKNADDLIAKWAKDGLPVSQQVLFGKVAGTINDFAKKNEVDLIIMGTKGAATGLKEIMIGSTTEKIVRTSLVPVITLKSYVKNPIKNIVFANSLVEDNEALVKNINTLQNLFGATLHMVYINSPGRFLHDHETKQRLNAFAERYMLKDYTIAIYNDLDPESGLTNFAKGIKADMVAMATHGRKGLANILNESIAEHVGYHMDCPLWTFKI